MFRKTTPDIFGEDEKFNLFNAKTIKEGTDVSIFCSGIMVSETLEANKILEEKGINAEIINIHTIKPIDEESIINSVHKTGAVVTVENHNIIGGLGSSVCEVLAEEYPCKVTRMGIQDIFGKSGKAEELMEYFGITAKNIVEEICKCE